MHFAGKTTNCLNAKKFVAKIIIFYEQNYIFHCFSSFIILSTDLVNTLCNWFFKRIPDFCPFVDSGIRVLFMLPYR